ncbi:MAG: cysteine hydrolase [Pseudomonadota bacterium]
MTDGVRPMHAAAGISGVLHALAPLRGRRTFDDLHRPALVVVDLQRLFCDPASPAALPDWPACVLPLRALVAAFRRATCPVIFTRHVHPDDDVGGLMGRFFDRLPRAGEVLAALDPALEDLWSTGPVVDKCRHSIFSAAELPALLDGCDALVLAGVQTPLCIAASALDASQVGLVPVVSIDATAARSAQQHLAALQTLAAGHAHVATVDEILDAWGWQH